MDNLEAIPLPLRDLSEHIIAKVREIMKAGEEAPGIALVGRVVGGEVTNIIDVSAMLQNKPVMKVMLSAMAQAGQIDFALMANEAWMVEHNLAPGEAAPASIDEAASRLGMDCPPSKHPDRVEVFFMSIETRDGYAGAATPIKSVAGGPRSIASLEFRDAGMRDGHLVGLFPRPTVNTPSYPTQRH